MMGPNWELAAMMVFVWAIIAVLFLTAALQVLFGS